MNKINIEISIYDIAFLIWRAGKFLGGNFPFLRVCQDLCLHLKLFTINTLTRAYIQDILTIFFDPSNARVEKYGQNVEYMQVSKCL